MQAYRQVIPDQPVEKPSSDQEMGQIMPEMGPQQAKSSD
jgi:hypothetical protein